jgi:hypothetical protein
LANELLLGVTVLSRGGTTDVPEHVIEALNLKPKPHKRSKLLWTQKEDEDEVIVTKGTPQSSFRKTMLRRNGTAAVPRHIQEALKLKPTLHKEDSMIWLQKGDEIIVRKGTPQSSPTD